MTTTGAGSLVLDPSEEDACFCWSCAGERWPVMTAEVLRALLRTRLTRMNRLRRPDHRPRERNQEYTIAWAAAFGPAANMQRGNCPARNAATSTFGSTAVARTPRSRRSLLLGQAIAAGIRRLKRHGDGRRRQAEQSLEQPVDMGGGEEVAAAHDMGHALRRIVERDGEMIAGRRVLAGEDDIAKASGRPLPLFVTSSVQAAARSAARTRRHIEPPGRGLRINRGAPARARIDRPVRGPSPPLLRRCRRGCRSRDRPGRRP